METEFFALPMTLRGSETLSSLLSLSISIQLSMETELSNVLRSNDFPFITGIVCHEDNPFSVISGNILHLV